jgi:hypothetical protein
VWLERKIEGPGTAKLRAVKGIHTDTEPTYARRYVRELEALAKFSQDKVGPLFIPGGGDSDISVTTQRANY